LKFDFGDIGEGVLIGRGEQGDGCPFGLIGLSGLGGREEGW